MLSKEDGRRLAELERQLWRDDPEFCVRMSGRVGRTVPRRSKAATLSLILTAVVVWAAAVLLGVFAWWIAAAIAAVCGTAVVSTLVIRQIRFRRADRRHA
jgi:membrane protein YdbS with pleckstrin-like domain